MARRLVGLPPILPLPITICTPREEHTPNAKFNLIGAARRSTVASQVRARRGSGLRDSHYHARIICWVSLVSPLVEAEITKPGEGRSSRSALGGLPGCCTALRYIQTPARQLSCLYL
nr:uncharacterized protein LOC128679225 [Plodia interpunctella]